MQTTLYVVLEQIVDGQGFAYRVLGEQEGQNDQQAITKFLELAETPLEVAATFVAVPHRSWRPKEVAPNRRFSFTG